MKSKAFENILFIVLLGLTCNSSLVRGADRPIDLDPPRQWLWLMQYRETGTGYESKIASPSFFLHPQGRSRMLLELKAQLEAFSLDVTVSPAHPQCLYPARYAVLRQHYSLKSPVNCLPFQVWRQMYGLSHISVMYAAQYLSNPASVFGHAFLLLGSDRVPDYQQVTFNYAADVPEEVGGFQYVYHGLTGGFQGAFSLLPFYHRLHVYTDMENRSLWEYKLALTSDERDWLAMYLWELQARAKIDYLFLTENCGSVLLWLFKATRPEIDITTSNPFYVAPGEVTQVLHREGLIAEAIFHPSLMERLRSKYTKMNDQERDRFRLVMKTGLLNEGADSQALLEAVLSHVAIERHRNGGDTPTALVPLETGALVRRAGLQIKGELPFADEERQTSPHLAHGPMRIGAGTVWRSNESALALTWRPSIHGLLDRESGYLKNSSIEFFETQMEIPRESVPRLQSVKLVAFANYRERDFYQTPLAWSFQLAWLRTDIGQDVNSSHIKLNGDIGLAETIGPITFYGALSAIARSRIVQPYDQFTWGPLVGLLASHRSWRSRVALAILHPQDPQRTISGDYFYALWQNQFELSQQWAMSAGFEATQSTASEPRHQQFDIGFAHFF